MQPASDSGVSALAPDSPNVNIHGEKITERRRQWGAALLLVFLSFVPMTFSWKADFLEYDDNFYVTLHPVVMSETLTVEKLFAPRVGDSYVPVTMLTYRVDRWLFSGWMPGVFGTWAPGVRLFNGVYHALAVLILWNLLRLLTQSRNVSFFVAAAFALHPINCEVCGWISQRNNCLAALFGFSVCWFWIVGEDRIWRVPVTLTFFALAMLGKPSALGLIPLLLSIELFGGKRGLNHEAPTHWKPSRQWFGIAARIMPFALMGLYLATFTIRSNLLAIGRPPGGNLFTAALTDVEIVARYVRNALLPFWLSAAYLVEPIRGLQEFRLWAYGLPLVGAISCLVFLSENRRMALFAAMWIVAGIAANLNFSPLAYWMQDRYFYLGLPGLLFLLAQAAKGAVRRWPVLTKVQLRYAIAVPLILWGALAIQRSIVWRSEAALFGDAVEKQPRCSFGHFAYGSALGKLWQADTPGSESFKRNYAAWQAEWTVAVLQCPDATRYSNYQFMANILGQEAFRRGDFANAERFWKRAVFRAPDGLPQAVSEAEASCGLARMALKSGDAPGALMYASVAVLRVPSAESYLLRASARLAFSKKLSADEKLEYCRMALDDLDQIAPGSPFAEEINALRLQLNK